MSEPQTTLKHIALEDIRESKEALRTIDRENEAYLGLVESVKIKGIMIPIGVRELIDTDTGEVTYGLIDGLQRFNSAKDVGLETIPAQVMSCEDGELLEAQIMANVHKVDTRPVEYSKALMAILQNNPLMTRTELAGSLAKTGAWISERLGLLKLAEQIGQLVDEGKIGLSNAYALAKLPQDEQVEFVDRAIAMPPQQFVPVVNTRVKEIRDANRKGRTAKPEEFVPVAMLRTRKDLVAELESPTIGPTLCEEFDPKTTLEAFELCVRWALNLDPRSVEVQRARDEERRADRERAKAESKIERKKKLAKDAADKAEKLKQEIEAETPAS